MSEASSRNSEHGLNPEKVSGPGVLIIGGGVTGISAARAMRDANVPVHIVEKQGRLGGHAAAWACMATRACVNCGACLSIDAAADAAQSPGITVHLNTTVSAVRKSSSTASGFDVTLANGEALAVRKIVVATGFSPFDPGRIGSYHVGAGGRHENIITTADLNALIRNDTLDGRLADKTAPEIAFFQCVGSRNREIGNDYCSQVCCRISMQHVNKLLHLYPDACITVFYIDLQVIGKEVRSFYKDISQNAELVQGVPAEILENAETGKLRVVTENRDDMTRAAREFDMVVLSVGMTPSDQAADTAEMLGMAPNAWGFFNTGDASLAEDVYVAGCARTPGGILASMQEGRIVAGKVVDSLGLPVRVAVLGDGGEALKTARAMAEMGCRTILVGRDLAGAGRNTDGNTDRNTDRDVEVVGNLVEVSGTLGNFSVCWEAGGKREYVGCDVVIAAYPVSRSDVLPWARPEVLGGLPSEKVMGVEAFAGLVAGLETGKEYGKAPESMPGSVIILLDYAGPERKEWARTALEAAIRARDAGMGVSVVMNKMLVHKAEGQRLYDAARKKGVAFLRFESPGDVRVENTGNGVALFMKEATLPSSLDVRVDGEVLVLPPAVAAPAEFVEYAAALREHVDREGFLQSPNARHRLVGSARRGIFFAGSGHDETDADDLAIEIDDIRTALKVRGVGRGNGEAGVAVNEKMCARCLTCFRICPHAAIVLGETMKPRIEPDACFSCHLCVSNCPAYAIGSETHDKDELAGLAEQGWPVVFACERSAWLAALEARVPDNVKVVKVPCTCRVNADVILKALLNGASKVVIAGCHPGNCRSMEGPREAVLGVRQVRNIPGIGEDRVVWAPVAANEPTTFERIVSKA